MRLVRACSVDGSHIDRVSHNLLIKHLLFFAVPNILEGKTVVFGLVVHCVHLIRFDLVLSLIYYLLNHFNVCILFSLVYMAVGFFLQNVILVLLLLLLL